MQFDPFVIPFNIGLYFILIYAVVRLVIWFRELSRLDKLRLQRGFFGRAFAMSLQEIFMESLIHRKILRSNFRLGYMHMSLAFGWFLLILFGTIEAVKTVSDMFMPVSGEILEKNAELENSPDLVNKDPYGKGWMIKIKISDPSELSALLTAEKYKAIL